MILQSKELTKYQKLRMNYLKKMIKQGGLMKK